MNGECYSLDIFLCYPTRSVIYNSSVIYPQCATSLKGLEVICLLIRIESFFDYVSGVSDGVLPWVVFLTACQGGHTMGRLVGRAKAGQVGI